MNFTKLVPNVFYHNIQDALTFFVECLEFQLEHDELQSQRPFCVVARNDLRINIFQDAKYAAEHYPEFRLVTENIEEAYNQIAASHPEFLHPNLNKVTLRPWGAKEFAIKDKQVGIIIQEW